jgi:hypothetical protein
VRVHPGNDLVAQVRVVLPGSGRVNKLAAAVARPRVDVDDDRRRRLVAGEDGVGGLGKGLPEGLTVEPHADLAGVPLDHVDARVAAFQVVVVPRRRVDEQRPLVRVAQRVPLEKLAGDDALVELASEIRFPWQHGVLLALGARPRWASYSVGLRRRSFRHKTIKTVTMKTKRTTATT